jgi:hypothetical protein
MTFLLDEARVIPYGDPDAGTTAAPPLRSLERA